jgi:hypothetical protein
VNTKPIVLKALLQQRHLHTHSAFRREYERVAARTDKALKAGWPSKAQFYRWLSGELVGLPHVDHCRVLESMFPGWTVAKLFEIHDGPLDFVPEPQTPQAANISIHLPRAFASSIQSSRAGSSPATTSSNTSEIVNAYPYRSSFPTAAWWDLISRATKQIDLLGYTLYFLSLEHPQFIETIRQKCENGCTVRAAIADPSSPHVAYRDSEEEQPITIVARINSTIKHFTPLVGANGFTVRYQDIPLYNSIFRFDDEMLVTPHLFATPGSSAPLLHLRKLGTNGLFDRFVNHFEDVWKATKPAAWASPQEAVNVAT